MTVIGTGYTATGQMQSFAPITVAPVSLYGNVELDVRYEDRSAFRWIGLGVGVPATLGGVLMLTLGALDGDDALVIGGAIVAGVGALAVLALGFIGDSAVAEVIRGGGRF